MKQILIFTDWNEKNLSAEVNLWIKNTDVTISDIQFQSDPNGHKVMIVYEHIEKITI